MSLATPERHVVEPPGDDPRAEPTPSRVAELMERALPVLRFVVRLLRGRRAMRLGLVLVLLALGSLGFAGTRYLRPNTPGSEVPLTSVSAAAVGHTALSSTFYDQDARVVITTPDGVFWSSYPHSDAQTSQLSDLLAKSGPVRIDSQADKATVRLLVQFILPILLLGTLFALLFTAGRGEGGAKEFAQFSKVKGGAQLSNVGGQQQRRKGVPPVTFANVAGSHAAVVELAEIVDYLRDPSRFAAVGALPPKGVLLFGPPGCGKTLLARAVAGEAGVPFYSLSGAEFVESLVGVGAARVRDLFAQIRRNAPAILFIDELDAAGRKRGAGVGGGNDEREQTLNQMLVEMDGFDSVSGVVVIGATNRPDILDPALLRPGRFDRHVTVDRPDSAGRFDLLRLYAQGRPVEVGVDLELLAKRTPGFTGAEIANVWNEAALLTVRAGGTTIGKDELDEAVQRVLAGPKRSSNALSEEERHLIACHEAGHAVVAAALGQADSVQRISIAQRGIGLGHAAVQRDDKLVHRRSELTRAMAIAVAGKATEELLFGEPSTGSEADVEHATDIARQMAGRYGMSQGIGPVRIVGKDAEVFLGRDMGAMQMIAPETLHALDIEIRQLVEAAEQVARDAVVKHRESLLRLARILGEKESLEGAELAALLAEVRPTPPARRARSN